MRQELEQYMSECQCPECKGRRLKPEMLAVTVGGKNISEFCDLSISAAAEFMEGLSLTSQSAMIAENILKEIKSRLGFLRSVGLQYLTLSRAAGSLSGGESQRIRLATQIGSSLVGVLYILDEPTTGLHIADVHRLTQVLQKLVKSGNTIISIEHNLDMIKICDHLIDLGPEGGENGGEIIAQGTPEEIAKNPKSYTGIYLKKMGI